MASLIAIGDAPNQLQVYLDFAVRSGTSDDEILDVINHASAYVGAPRAVNALRAITDYLTTERERTTVRTDRAWGQLDPWLQTRRELPIGALLCVMPRPDRRPALGDLRGPLSRTSCSRPAPTRHTLACA